MTDPTPADLLARGRSVLANQPFSRLLGTELVGWSGEEVELRLALRSEHMQQHGFAHGGVVSYLADNALTFAGGAALGSAVVTSEMKINYVRPGLGEALVARARAIAAGQTQAVTRCEVYAVKDGVERLCAAAQGTITRLGTSPAD